MTQKDALVLTDVLAYEMGYLKDLYVYDEITGELINQAHENIIKAVIDLVEE